MVREKISIAEHNEKRQDVIDITKELAAAKAEFEKIEKYEIIDNCPECKGSGRVRQEEDATSLAFNPYGYPLYKDCPNCKGKGYTDD